MPQPDAITALTSELTGWCGLVANKLLGFFGRRRINYFANNRDLVGRETSLFGVLADHLFVRRDVHAINFAVCDVTLNLLYCGSKIGQNATGFRGNSLKIISDQFSCAGNFAFDNVLWHDYSPS